MAESIGDGPRFTVALAKMACEDTIRSLAFVVLFSADEEVGAVRVVDLGTLGGNFWAIGRGSSCEEAVPLSDDGVGLVFLADASFSATILCETNLASGVEGPFVFLRRCNGDLTRAAAWRVVAELARGDDIAGRVLILVGDNLLVSL